LISCSLYKVM